MSKTRKPAKNPAGHIESLEFIRFWLFIAQQLGSSRLKINAGAVNIHELIDQGNDAKDYLKTAIKESYKRSQCNHLRSTISIDSVLDILGETAFALRHNHRDDLFDIELLEEIAWYIDARYKIHLVIEAHDIKSKSTKQGQLVSFPNYKIRAANTRL